MFNVTKQENLEKCQLYNQANPTIKAKKKNAEKAPGIKTSIIRRI